MYKVFVNDAPIILTSSSQKVNNFSTFSFNEISFNEILTYLKNDHVKGIIIYSTDLERDWKSFCNNLEVIPAAGGLVFNDKKEVLFIFRNNVWDLPKGWIEKNETIEDAAIREVEEECGIANLKLINPIINTYHIYFHEGVKLKETFWFLMFSDDKHKLTPQIEEGITKVKFINEKDVYSILENSYANIKLVYNSYKKSLK